MKRKIVFHDLKVQIYDNNSVFVRFYGELMYIVFDKPYCIFYFTGDQKRRVEVNLHDVFDNLPEKRNLIC